MVTAKTDDRFALTKTLIAFTVLTVVFLFIALGSTKGVSTQQIAIMCQSLGSEAPDKCTQEWAIAWLGTSAWGALREVAQMAANGAIWVYFVGACLGFLPVLLVSYLYELSIENEADRHTFMSIILLPFAFTIPLYIFALDWGRWFNVTYLFILMSILFFIKMRWLRRRISDGQASSELNDHPALRRFVKPLLAVAVTLYLVSWSVPVCCGTTLGKGILGVAERAVSRIH
jgi:hypothetical protein